MLNDKDVFPSQQVGKPVAALEAFPLRIQSLIKDLPVWNDYRLIQHTADAFTIDKRTNSASTWLDANAGKRAKGLVFVGDSKGSMAVALKDFWQSYPAAVEVRDAAKEMAEIRLWLWSPYQTAMDMRHYDTVAHGLDATYEDVQPGLSTPYGVARTCEIMLYPGSGIPTNDMLSNQAAIKKLIEQKKAGTILNMGSVLGFSPSPKYFSTHAYAATKAAIIGFSKSIASYYAKDNIRVNVIAPALVETPMAQRAANDENILSFIKTKQPLDGGGIGQPSDLDGLAVYFLSDQSKYTTGQMIAVDGGWSVSEGQY